MNRQLSRSIIAAGACIGAGLAFQPIYAEPSLHALAIQSGELILRSGGTILVTFASAYVIHRIKTWEAERPVLPAPSQLYAVSSMGPTLANEVAVEQAHERQTEEGDIECQTRQAIIRFCINGEWYGSFAYSVMHAHCDRPTWDWMTRFLSQSGVLRIGRGQRPTWFTESWNSVRVRVALNRGELIPPYPTDQDDVPVVVWADYRRAMHASMQANIQTC